MSTQQIAAFTSYLKEQKRSQSTIIAYTKDLRQLSTFIEGKLEELTSAQLTRAIAKMSKELDFTPKTVSRKLNSYRLFFRFLKESNIITKNPAEEINHPRFVPKKPRVLSQSEYLALREVTRNNVRLHTMIELLLQTGMRIGEIARINIQDVRLQKPKPQIFVEEFSTNAARYVPISEKLIQVIETYIQSLPKGKVTDSTPLFHTREGKPIIIRNIRSAIDRAMAKAGIEKACVNDIRNTFIVVQLEAGVPIDLVAEVVGHRSKVTTNKYLDLLSKKYKPNGSAKIVEL